MRRVLLFIKPVSYTHLWQKGRLEKNHEFIRYIIPKGTTFAGLDQEQVTLITNQDVYKRQYLSHLRVSLIHEE